MNACAHSCVIAWMQEHAERHEHLSAQQHLAQLSTLPADNDSAAGSSSPVAQRIRDFEQLAAAQSGPASPLSKPSTPDSARTFKKRISVILPGHPAEASQSLQSQPSIQAWPEERQQQAAASQRKMKTTISMAERALRQLDEHLAQLVEEHDELQSLTSPATSLGSPVEREGLPSSFPIPAPQASSTERSRPAASGSSNVQSPAGEPLLHGAQQNSRTAARDGPAQDRREKLAGKKSLWRPNRRFVPAQK